MTTSQETAISHTSLRITERSSVILTDRHAHALSVGSKLQRNAPCRFPLIKLFRVSLSAGGGQPRLLHGIRSVRQSVNPDFAF